MSSKTATAEPETFNLRALIRDVLATSALNDPGALAKEVSKRVPDEHLRDAFEEMLRGYVQNTIVKSRSFPHGSAGPEPVRPAAGRPVNRSSKRAAIYRWAAPLRERVHVGPSATDWKMLGDCGIDDLDFVAAERENIAANRVKAEQYRKVRDLLVKHGAKTVRDLPEAALAEIFGGAQ